MSMASKTRVESAASMNRKQEKKNQKPKKKNLYNENMREENLGDGQRHHAPASTQEE